MKKEKRVIKEVLISEETVKCWKCKKDISSLHSEATATTGVEMNQDGCAIIVMPIGKMINLWDI